MKKLLIIFTLFILGSCTDNKKIIQDSKQMHSDSAKSDSIKYIQKSKENEKINGIILDGRIYTKHQLDSIFAGKK